MRRLAASGLLPERAGQPVKAWVHISLAGLLAMQGSTALVQAWVTQLRAQWAAHRAAASVSGSDPGAWLDGQAAAAVACDAAMAPYVTGDVNPAALEDLVRLCTQLGRLRHGSGRADDTSDADSTDGTGHAGQDGCDDGAPGTAASTGDGDAAGSGASGQPAPGPDRTPPGRGRPWSRRSSARPSTFCRVRAGWRRTCAATSSAAGWAGRACRWTSATARASRRGSATR